MLTDNGNLKTFGHTVRRILTATVLTSLALIGLYSQGNAAGDTKIVGKSSRANQKYPSELKIAEHRADVFTGATKISFSSSTEYNILGFRVWRDAAGNRDLVSNEMIAGGFLTVANGALPAGAQYVLYDRNQQPNVYYWIEAVDINSSSTWFGPVYPQVSFDSMANERESQTIAQLNEVNRQRAAQIEYVPFNTPNKRKKQASRSNAVSQPFTTNPNALKIEVNNRGLSRIDSATLQSKGFLPNDASNWHLYAGGIEQPMVVNSDGSIEFVGRTLDTVQTAANTYWLVADSHPGRRINRMPSGFDAQAQEGNMRVVAERRDRIIRVSSVINGARENWFTAVVNPNVVNQTLNLSDIAVESGQTATIGVDVQGLTAVVHRVSVKLNGLSIGEFTFNGYNRIEWAANVPTSSLLEGVNTITLQAIGGNTDINVAEAVRINYPRRLRSRNDRLEFSVPAGPTGTKVKGFSTSNVRLFDITDPMSVSEWAPETVQETDGTHTLTVAAAQTARLIMAVGGSAPPHLPSPIVRNGASDLRNPENSATFLIISPAEFQPDLGVLTELRSAQGIETKLVDIEDIYDEFNDGVPSAEAIRSFLQYASGNWNGRPEYVMLVGDASIDPRNFTGVAGPAVNRVPTFLIDTWNMETVSDEMIVDFSGDSVGELMIGRLPVKNREELQIVTEKIVMTSPWSRDEINERGIHFISDGPVGYDFSAGSRNVGSSLPVGITVNYLDAEGVEVNAMRSQILGRINAGAAIINYFGHGSISVWAGSQMFRTVDVPNLYNPKKPAFFSIINCLNGDFAETGIDSMAETLIRRDHGGAFAVWASSGWNGAYDQEWYAKDFYRFVKQGMPAARAAQQAKLLFPITDLRRTYIYFGDPTQSLIIP